MRNSGDGREPGKVGSHAKDMLSEYFVLPPGTPTVPQWRVLMIALSFLEAIVLGCQALYRNLEMSA